MESYKRLFYLAICLCLVVSCSSPVDHSEDQRRAREGLDSVVSQLPQVSDFNTVKILYREFRSEENDNSPICYYARAFLVIGSSQLEDDALNIYTKQILALGWMPRDKQYENTRVFFLGTNNRLVARVGQPSVDIESDIDYAQLLASYKSIVFVEIDFMLPSRDVC